MAEVTVQTSTTQVTIAPPPTIDLHIEPPKVMQTNILPPAQTVVYVAPAEIVEVPAETQPLSLVYNEQLRGADGVKASFETGQAFVPESVEVFVNGLKQATPQDYSTMGTTTIQFSVSPDPTDTLLVNYLKP